MIRNTKIPCIDNFYPHKETDKQQVFIYRRLKTPIMCNNHSNTVVTCGRLKNWEINKNYKRQKCPNKNLNENKNLHNNKNR
jgi:hypothetical protein